MTTRNLEARLGTYTPVALTVFRVVVGLLFLCHGLQKLIGWPVGPTVPVGEWPFYYAGWIETVTGALVTLGLFTRVAAFVASGEMAVAYFTQHFPHGFWPIVNQGELAVLYCFAFLLLVFIGGGVYALDSRRAGAGWGGRRAGAPWNRRRGAPAETGPAATGAGWQGRRGGGFWNRLRRNRQIRGR
ncbi:DoxX family protein [uncultured Mycobacterium sp.]|uniref:DoxX family protein n=1 Tax=uncultured Mycobacterium sp. TaxID=171292 RepID=UPI0035CC2BBC